MYFADSLSLPSHGGGTGSGEVAESACSGGRICQTKRESNHQRRALSLLHAARFSRRELKKNYTPPFFPQYILCTVAGASYVFFTPNQFYSPSAPLDPTDMSLMTQLAATEEINLAAGAIELCKKLAPQKLGCPLAPQKLGCPNGFIHFLHADASTNLMYRRTVYRSYTNTLPHTRAKEMNANTHFWPTGRVFFSLSFTASINRRNDELAKQGDHAGNWQILLLAASNDLPPASGRRDGRGVKRERQ